MKRILFLVVIICRSVFLSADCAAQKADPLGGIALSPYVPVDGEEAIPQHSREMLGLKLRQIANLNSIGGLVSNPRFIVTAIINVNSKDITSTAPPMIALNLEVTFLIGDGKKGKIFATAVKNIRGAGSNEVKAYNNAITNIRAEDKDIQEFVTAGKQKVLDYFRTRCIEVIREADLYLAANEYEAAVYTLCLVPRECDQCFNDCLVKLREVMTKKSVYNCDRLLLKARAQWATSLDGDAADSAAAILDQIGPDMNTPCNKQVKEFIAEMSATMKQRNNREWDYKERQQQARIDLANDMMGIARNYAKSHISTPVYNIHTWQ